MIVTLKEAKKLWCPMSKEGPELLRAMCLGDKCMAWRWHNEANEPFHNEKSGEWSRKGYCGMAGRPE